MTRYIRPLREGGSLPALAEADDGYLYVLKFRGAGQGVKVLIAELLGGEIARHLGLKVPELVYADLDVSYGRTEPDEEIQDLLKASTGLNLALHFLTGSYTFDPAVMSVDPYLASKIVWLDAFLMNVDRTARNTNMLSWNKELWLIDHGAAMYFQHNWEQWEETAQKPFVQIKDHVLLKRAEFLDEVHQDFNGMLEKSEFLIDLVAGLPEEWLLSPVFTSASTGELLSPESIRQVYLSFLQVRLSMSDIFLNEAKNARKRLI